MKMKMWEHFRDFRFHAMLFLRGYQQNDEINFIKVQQHETRRHDMHVRKLGIDDKESRTVARKRRQKAQHMDKRDQIV